MQEMANGKTKFNSRKESKISIIDIQRDRILCVSNINGDFTNLERLVKKVKATAVIHTGCFGFLSSESLERLSTRLLEHLLRSSNLMTSQRKDLLLAYPTSLLKNEVKIEDLSQFPLYFSGIKKFSVPIYTTYGSTEDFYVLNDLVEKDPKIHNLNFLHSGNSKCLKIGSLSLRLLGFGGAFLRHKLFDHGNQSGPIAGSEDGVWSTFIQLGEILETARSVEKPTETRILVSHHNPSSEPVISQLAAALKADFSFYPGYNFQYTTSYNQFSINSDIKAYRRRLEESSKDLNELWLKVKPIFEKRIHESHHKLIQMSEAVFEQLPALPGSGIISTDPYFMDSWHYSLANITHGYVVLNVLDSCIGCETFSNGVDFSFRRSSLLQQTGTSTSENVQVQTTNSLRQKEDIGENEFAKSQSFPNVHSHSDIVEKEPNLSDSNQYPVNDIALSEGNYNSHVLNWVDSEKEDAPDSSIAEVNSTSAKTNTYSNWDSPVEDFSQDNDRGKPLEREESAELSTDASLNSETGWRASIPKGTREVDWIRPLKHDIDLPTFEPKLVLIDSLSKPTHNPTKEVPIDLMMYLGVNTMIEPDNTFFHLFDDFLHHIERIFLFRQNKVCFVEVKKAEYLDDMILGINGRPYLSWFVHASKKRKDPLHNWNSNGRGRRGNFNRSYNNNFQNQNSLNSHQNMNRNNSGYNNQLDAGQARWASYTKGPNPRSSPWSNNNTP